MIIDVHTHVGDLRGPDSMKRKPVSWSSLLQRLDEEGIDKAVLLPIGCSPESISFPSLFFPEASLVSQIKAARRRSDRIIPFGNLDPRMGGAGNQKPEAGDKAVETDFSWILERFLELGCSGVGEVTAHIPFDSPLTINMVRQCAAYGLAVLFHGSGPETGFYGLWDAIGSPRLERLLQAVPEATLIGHGPGFWAEISADLTPETKNTYPKGPVRQEGSLPRLLRRYKNLYADISANSGHNAISRDRTYGVKFLNEFQDRILLGTDVCYGDAEGRMPHLSYLRELLAQGAISREVFDKITGSNAQKLLKVR